VGTVELISAFGALLLALQSGVLIYCIKIEHRLTKVETIVRLWQEEKRKIA
jgi:hypothetical protein